MGVEDFIGDVVSAFPSPAINYGLNLYQQHQARGEAREMREADAELQREFAKNGIKWKVQDAIDAGIHPLAALGASGYSASPSAVGVPPYDYTSPLREMGQNISRAVSATQTVEDRVLSRLRIQRELAEIDLLKAQTTSIARPSNPPMPSSLTDRIPLVHQGAVDVGQITGRKQVDSVRMAESPTVGPDVDYSITDSGLSPQIPEWLSESMEGESPFLPIGQVMWTTRNRVVPNVSFGTMGKPSRAKLPDWATDWKWSYLRQEWQPVGKYRKGGR